MLALSSSQTSIRRAIVESGHISLFVELIDQSDDPSVRSHAAIALAKFAAGEDDVRKLTLQDDELVSQLMGILDEVLGPMDAGDAKQPMVAQHTVAPDPLVSTGDYTNTIVSSVIEALSYFSIHVEVKKAMAHHKQVLIKKE